MNGNRLNPQKALNKAFLKVRVSRAEIEKFKANAIDLLDRIDERESEEFHKNLVSGFLKNTWYDPGCFINTKGRTDLVIHNGEHAESAVGVIIETKRPGNTAEMCRTDHLNTKALQELLLYFLRERITHKNDEIRHLIITNIYEWFIFDARLFDRLFAQDKSLVNKFEDFEAGRLSGTDTTHFYRGIAAPAIEEAGDKLEFTWFDLRGYEHALRNENKRDDTRLIALYKLLSPEHLLKLPFANDSNSLNRQFYTELLHIIGLTETQKGGKKVIERNKEGKRCSGSLIENTIIQLESLDKVSRLSDAGRYGTTHQERLFNVALELVITWMNRILFLKLLEAQLIAWHKDKDTYSFVNSRRIRDFDSLNGLFFQVLARRPKERNEDVRRAFAHIPYLNSSLFDPTDIEHQGLFISQLQDDKTLPVYASTVLKDARGRRRTGELASLRYLFEFLDAYDFSSEGPGDIREDHKSLINASVLGLIFEKINGYRDGSFFTPGFVTMYMCRETIRRAVIGKFNEAGSRKTGGNLPRFQSLDDIYEAIGDDRLFTRQEANTIINSLKICDPAVGSGHFLVSALNEIIAVKNELKILLDRNGRTLRDYHVEVENDELIITDNDGILFEYHPNHPESRRVQEAIFNEKQTIIENCLFGVDINLNSVNICRLRLWIELLKHAYYREKEDVPDHPKSSSPVCYIDEEADFSEDFLASRVVETGAERQLETLPNIDINIKCGNSLISRFALDADIGQALKKSKWTVESYRLAVDSYRNAANKEQKREMQRLINDIKNDFRSEISSNDPRVKRLNKLSGELYNLLMQRQMFEPSNKELKAREKKREKLETGITKLKQEIEEIKSNKIYENAFEWRFEFPEVLNDAGDFTGFDVVLGNPPYVRQETFGEWKPWLSKHYAVYQGTADLYSYFIELGARLLHENGHFQFIVANKWMRANYGKPLRKWLRETVSLDAVYDFGDLPVFEEATTYPCLLQFQKRKPGSVFKALEVENLDFDDLQSYLETNRYDVHQDELSDDGWTLTDTPTRLFINRI